MGLFCPIIRISSIVMNGIWDQLTMTNSIAAQFIGHDLPGFTTMTS
jgi:hypothetical protein